MKQELSDVISSMSHDELYNVAFVDHVTGALNRKAFELCTHKDGIAIVDLDSLKFINDEHGHRKGDMMLKSLATQLINSFGHDNVYRLSGDEFVVIVENQSHAYVRLRRLQSKVLFFSFGVGRDLVVADTALNYDKDAREIAGTRASRGEMPPWFYRYFKRVVYSNDNFKTAI